MCIEDLPGTGSQVQSAAAAIRIMRTGTAALVLRTIFEALLYRRCPHLDQLKIEDLKEAQLILCRCTFRYPSGAHFT
jgi:hypothetical protein